MPERVVLGIGASGKATIQQCVEAWRTIARPEWVLASVATLETKARLVSSVAEELGVPLILWRAEELSGVRVPSPSARVFDEVGSASVAEASALLAARGGPLALAKCNVGPVSVAVACVKD